MIRTQSFQMRFGVSLAKLQKIAIVSFELPVLDSGGKLPKTQIVANTTMDHRSAECGYAGATT